MNLLDLMVKVGVDDQATSKIGALSGDLGGKLATAAKVGAAALAAVTAAAVGVTTALVSNVREVAEYGDNIDKMSQKMGISANAYQEWDAVMRHSGTSMESLKVGMKTLANAVESGNDAFQRIGITQEQIANMNQEELFAATIEGLQNVDDETERTYLAGQLLGRGATELGALLNMSAAETQAMKDRVHELGGVMSDESVKASAAFQDSLQDFNTAMTGVRNSLVTEFLPGFTTVMDGLQELISGDMDKGQALVEEGVEKIVERIKVVGPRLVEIIERIADVIAPVLVKALGALLAAVVTEIVTHIPDILAAAGKLVMALVEGFVNGLVPMMRGAEEVVNGALRAIGGFFVSMWNSGVELINNLINGVGNAISGLPGLVGSWIEAAWQTVVNWVTSFYNAGVNLVQGLIDGIANNFWAVIDTITGGLSNAVDSALSFLGIASPSKLFAWIGDMTMEGMAEGIEDTAEKAERAMRRAAEGVYRAADGEVDLTANVGMAAGVTAPQNSPGVIINVERMEVRDDRDIRAIADELYRLMSRQGGGAIWNGSYSAA